jgi:hypothetical protein
VEVVTEAKGHMLRDMNLGCIHIDDSSGIHVEKEIRFVPKPHSLYISFFRIEASFLLLLRCGLAILQLGPLCSQQRNIHLPDVLAASSCK